MNSRTFSVRTKLMKVNVTFPNSSLTSIIEAPDQVITLDANFLIPPSRSRLTNRQIKFSNFQEIWLDPIFKAFPNLAIHEAVYKEIIGSSALCYIDAKMNSKPSGIIIHRDSSLTDIERVLRDTIEAKIAPLTSYDPLLNNKDDRGEVKSLSYIAVKGLLYFAAHDNNAIQLVEKAEEWSTGLDNIQVIKMYELIYYLYKNNLANNKALKMLYKYQYYLTKNEQDINPDWGMFVHSMDKLYDLCF